MSHSIDMPHSPPPACCLNREMLVGADRCLGDVVSEMLSTIEDSEEPHEEAHVYLVTLFPQFSHIFSELKEVCFFGFRVFLC